MTGTGLAVYRAFVLLSIVLPGMLIVIGVRLMLSVDPPFPTGFLFYYPVILGVFGIIGLGRVAIRPASAPGARVVNDVVLLSAGLLGAVLSVFVLRRYLFLPGTAAGWVGPLLVAGGPVAIALFEILRHAPAMREQRTARSSTVAIVILILVLPIAIALGRTLAKNVSTAWYGRHFPANAIESAQRIAGGAAFRISAPGHLPDATFDDLDADAILDRAFENHFKVGGLNGRWIQPHMTLHVGEESYRWSFRQGEFYGSGRGLSDGGAADGAAP